MVGVSPVGFAGVIVPLHLVVSVLVLSAPAFLMFSGVMYGIWFAFGMAAGG